VSAGQRAAGSGRRTVLAAFAANLGIAATKFAAFVITGSASMLAESVHSVADSGNQALLLIGRSRAQREETEEHQFGFGAERYLYGFLVALLLFTLGAVFSVYEGIHRILHPESLDSPVVALVVLVLLLRRRQGPPPPVSSWQAGTPVPTPPPSAVPATPGPPSGPS